MAARYESFCIHLFGKIHSLYSLIHEKYIKIVVDLKIMEIKITK